MARILIVDDEKLIRDLYKDCLKEEGHTIYLARNGEDAIELIEDEENLDLIIMDVKMPIQDGFEFIPQLKSRPNLSSIPIIVASAHIGPQGKEHLFSMGIEDYLDKPISINDLIDAVNSALNKSKK